MFYFSKRSRSNLVGLHTDLIVLATTTLSVSPVDFAIIEGRRTIERQTELFNAVPKKTWTMNSRHLHGLAIDFMAYVDGVGTWEEKYYGQIAEAFKAVSTRLGIPIVWGGDWAAPKTDSDHIELSPLVYPDNSLIA